MKMMTVIPPAVTLSDALVAVHTLPTFMEQDFLSFKDETDPIFA